jgi:mycobactin polyketide synthetase MbtD
VPVLVSADSPDLLTADAVALRSYVTDHPEVAPQRIADMLFRTRSARRYRAVAMVSDREGLLGALEAVAAGRDHPLVVRGDSPAVPGRIAYVFPGQGGQRPGMGRLFYQTVPAFRAEVDRCATEFEREIGRSPLPYLLDVQSPADDAAGTVQPALFTYMAGLAATWRSFGVSAQATVGHSQGEIAAAYVAGLMTLTDAVRTVGIRADAADSFTRGDYAMAVVAAPRDECEDLIARCDGWAQVSVVNSPTMVGISGDRTTVEGIVDTLDGRGVFARTLRVRYPAHTTLITQVGDRVRTDLQRRLKHLRFLDAESDCIGSTFGDVIVDDVSVDRYWFYNLRNPVRFDKAVTAAADRDITAFVELAEHPTLQLAIRENLTSDETSRMVVGTSNRAAEDLDEFTRNLLLVSVHDAEFDWAALGLESDRPAPLPLLDFPNSAMRDVRSWLPYTVPSGRQAPPTVAPAAPAAPAAAHTVPRLLVEEWVRLSQRSLVPPRTLGIVDHTGECADLAAALCHAAEDIGATGEVVGGETPEAASDTRVILVPPYPALDDTAAAAAVADFFGSRTWWTGLPDGVTECWLVTIGGEMVDGDPPPHPVAAALSAGFRSVGAEHPGVRFRHLDLATAAPDDALAIVAALHTGDESELVLRSTGLYAKRAADHPVPEQDSTPPEHVLITGGTGTLGLEFCEHFARRGARRITLVSRSGETGAVADRLDALRSATSTRIQITRCDLGDEASVSRLADEYRDTPADLVIHAAVQYSGAELADLSVDAVGEALRAKVVGLRLLLNAFPRTDDCRIVLCSSVGASVGGRGLIAYAAANRMLDAIAHRLRADGVECVAVQWGQWSVTFDPDAASTAKLGVTGLLPMAPGDAMALGLSRLPGNAIVAAIDVDRARLILDTCGRAELLAALNAPAVPTAVTDGGGDLSQRFLTLLAGAIGVDGADTIDTTVPMVAIGLDSLQALEFRRRVKLEFDHDLEVADLLGGASIGDVLAQLQARP